MKSCVVDQKHRKEKEDQITFFKKKWSPALGKLEADIAWLEKELAQKRKEYDEKNQPLVQLENELARIMVPAIRKKKLQKLLKREIQWAEEFQV